MQDATAVTTFLFTDIEGSTRLWEQEPQRMRSALARHDAIARSTVEKHRGTVVKMTGDGLHAAFDDPLDAIRATIELQRALADPGKTGGIALAVRCGLHAGPNERRDGDYYGTVVNRAARVMGVAHGGQMLVSQALAELVDGSLPEAASLRELGLVRLRDLSSPERIFQLVAPGLRSEFPPLRSLAATPNNLPQALSSFVGRQRELAEVRSLLRRNRLVTLVGMGGVGKSRLALHAAAESMDDHPDGVWLVELAPIHEPARIGQAIASALGLKEEVGRPIEEAIARHVRNRGLLLILDNCEHLIEGCAAASRALLAAGPRVKVLVTSRESLHLAGEGTYVVTGLRVPGPLDAMTALGASHYEAVRLFLDRARPVLREAELSDADATSIAAICHRLDGIPLAIELAAARARSMSVAQIETRLKDRFRLLTSGDRTALPRQRTLRALIDWSYDLLPEAERRLFGELSVFAGGWTLEAAEAVCTQCGDEESVLDLLGRLVEKSLVVFDAPSTRYGFLETVRQYARERLEESGRAAETRDRHLDFFAALAQAAKPHLSGDAQEEWLARLDLERENILSAHEWAGTDDARAQHGLRMLNGLKFYWAKRGLLRLADRVMGEAIARPGAKVPNLARAQALFHAGSLRYFMGRPAEARAALEESLAIARALNEPRGIAMVLQSLGLTAVAQGDLASARRYVSEAIETAQARDDKPSLAGALTAMALLDRVEGHPRNAAPLYERVVQLGRESGNVEAEAIGLLNHAMLMLDEGDLAAAAQMVAEAIGKPQAASSRSVLQSALDVCAGLAGLRGDWARAARLFGASETHALETGFRRDTADARFLEPKMEKARAVLGEHAYLECEAAGRRLGHVEALHEVRECLGLGQAPSLVAPVTSP